MEVDPRRLLCYQITERLLTRVIYAMSSSGGDKNQVIWSDLELVIADYLAAIT